MASHKIGNDPFKYATMNFWPIICQETGRALITNGRDIIKTKQQVAMKLQYPDASNYILLQTITIRSRPTIIALRPIVRNVIGGNGIAAYFNCIGT